MDMDRFWCASVLWWIGNLAMASEELTQPVNDNVTGEPLFLTPYIESGLIEEAQTLAANPPLLDDVVTYSGFLTVNKTTESNLFFWFFPCEKDPDNAPVAVWLQGGPGATSMFAAFTENSPLEIAGDTLKRRSRYWTESMSMIYLDQPVGTGFSFTRNEHGWANSQEDVARDVYAALQQFFDLFPVLRDNDFFVTGESYGGKYVPSVAYGIHQYNPSFEKKINLKGVAIGNGGVDTVTMFHWANLLFTEGFVDIKTRDRFAAIEDEAINLLANKEYMKAWWLLDEYFYGDLSPTTILTNVTGIKWYYNLLSADQDHPDDPWINYLVQPQVRNALHVGNLNFTDISNEVARHLMLDRFVSAVPKLEVLLDNNYRVLLYNGQLDIACAYPLTANFVSKMNWNGKEDFDKSTNQKWFVGKDLAGYVKTSGNFAHVLVRNAGHMVPTDQPVWCLDMITNFVLGQPLNTVPS